MTAPLIILSVIIALFVFINIRRLILTRSVRQYDAPTLSSALKAGENLVLLDVRTGDERSRRHIPGSKHIPVQELRQKLREMEKWRDKVIVCYCQSGNRSLHAAAFLRKQGFQVANLKGGITGWNVAGMNQ